MMFSENDPCLRIQKVDYLLLLFKDVFRGMLKEFQSCSNIDKV